MLAQQAAIWRE